LSYDSTANNRAVRAERGPTPHDRFLKLVAARYVASGIDHVCKHNGRPAEDVILEDHTRIDRYVVLNLDVIPYHDAGRNNDVLSDVATRPNLRARHNVREMPNRGVVTDGASFIDIARIVRDERGHHTCP
jgi:hypothetical protein